MTNLQTSDLEQLKNTALAFVNEGLAGKGALSAEAEELHARTRALEAGAAAATAEAKGFVADLEAGKLTLTDESRPVLLRHFDEQIETLEREDAAIRAEWSSWWARVADFETWARAQAQALDVECALTGVAICPAALERQIEEAPQC